jgi:hypothetical protein
MPRGQELGKRWRKTGRVTISTPAQHLLLPHGSFLKASFGIKQRYHPSPPEATTQALLVLFVITLNGQDSSK